MASRLTIAQAALLNLRGQELRQAAKISTLPVIGERRRHATPDYPYNDFSSNSIQLPAPARLLRWTIRLHLDALFLFNVCTLLD